MHNATQFTLWPTSVTSMWILSCKTVQEWRHYQKRKGTICGTKGSSILRMPTDLTFPPPGASCAKRPRSHNCAQDINNDINTVSCMLQNIKYENVHVISAVKTLLQHFICTRNTVSKMAIKTVMCDHKLEIKIWNMIHCIQRLHSRHVTGRQPSLQPCTARASHVSREEHESTHMMRTDRERSVSWLSSVSGHMGIRMGEHSF
jgi:hypothetical protein